MRDDELVGVPVEHLKAYLAAHIKETRFYFGSTVVFVIFWVLAWLLLGQWYSGVAFIPFAVLYGIRGAMSYYRARLCLHYLKG